MSVLYTHSSMELRVHGCGICPKHVGVGGLRLDASGIEGTDEFANETGVFGVSDFTVIVCGGIEALPNLGIGAALKYYSQALPDNPGKGVTGDIGLLFIAPSKKLRVGASMKT